ncbi:acyl-protein synthetase [Celerinatantimonas sp. MCCC 1A17872]|uniref:LuxE/PaaK family acyltransferase n=1 Tax=Celerinatantimonas sp. MCCC 1A17872 TaxID=3177514 RepID=UPI0038C94373
MDSLWNAPIYGLSQQDKERLLLARLNELTRWHSEHCPSYNTLLEGSDLNLDAEEYCEVLPLAVQLFKLARLSSIADDEVFKTITSSGTSGAKSQIILDRANAALQSKALVKIMQSWVGRARLPMLLIEQSNLIAQRSGFSARGAGALGLSFMGRDHCYALDDKMQPNWPVIEAFVKAHQNQPVLIFGFTFMLWQYLLKPLAEQGVSLDLSQAIIFHSGGWKKLQHLSVSSEEFNQQCEASIGSNQVHNFYGMAEQTGSIFVSCEHGHLHCPIFSDILIRNPVNLAPSPMGEPGLIQVFSSLAQSYPGQSILTEDIGIWLGDDDCPCGRKGRYFKVLGREQKAEVRGCSDTFS